MGETAPLILLVGINQKINFNPFSFSAETATRRRRCRRSSSSSSRSPPATPTIRPSDRAWGAALVLIAIIMLLNLTARLIARFTRARG